MVQQIAAIYDNGVFRPLEPLALPDQAHVKLTVDAESAPVSEDKLQSQKEALRKLWEELDKVPQHKNNDGWSVRQHDELQNSASNDLVAASTSSLDFWDNPEDDEDWNVTSAGRCRE
jgi:predicted DNA-binding antitoxin AbrB/MazE fold protein